MPTVFYFPSISIITFTSISKPVLLRIIKRVNMIFKELWPLQSKATTKILCPSWYDGCNWKVVRRRLVITSFTYVFGIFRLFTFTAVFFFEKSGLTIFLEEKLVSMILNTITVMIGYKRSRCKRYSAIRDEFGVFNRSQFPMSIFSMP